MTVRRRFKKHVEAHAVFAGKPDHKMQPQPRELFVIKQAINQKIGELVEDFARLFYDLEAGQQGHRASFFVVFPIQAPTDSSRSRRSHKPSRAIVAAF